MAWDVLSRQGIGLL